MVWNFWWWNKNYNGLILMAEFVKCETNASNCRHCKMSQILWSRGKGSRGLHLERWASVLGLTDENIAQVNETCRSSDALSRKGTAPSSAVYTKPRGHQRESDECHLLTHSSEVATLSKTIWKVVPLKSLPCYKMHWHEIGPDLSAR